MTDRVEWPSPALLVLPTTGRPENMPSSPGLRAGRADRRLHCRGGCGSRRALTHKGALTLEACHAREIIEPAFARYGVPQTVNADQGSQFTADAFTDAVLGKGCKLSMDGRGAWRGDWGFCHNVVVERLWRSVKYERVYRMACDSVGAARASIAQYFGWYKTERPHASLERSTPMKVYEELLPELAKAA